MGMYTEIVIKAFLQEENIDAKIWDILNFLFNDADEPSELPDHPFFKSERWQLIGRCNSYYHIPKCLNFLKDGYLFSRSDLKDYGGEIDMFFDWLDPYISAESGECIGWSWYEQNEAPRLIFKK